MYRWSYTWFHFVMSASFEIWWIMWSRRKLTEWGRFIKGQSRWEAGNYTIWRYTICSINYCIHCADQALGSKDQINKYMICNAALFTQQIMGCILDHYLLSPCPAVYQIQHIFVMDCDLSDVCWGLVLGHDTQAGCEPLFKEDLATAKLTSNK